MQKNGTHEDIEGSKTVRNGKERDMEIVPASGSHRDKRNCERSGSSLL